MNPFLWLIGCFLLIVPLSVDQHLSIPFGDYDLRLGYVGTLILSVVVFIQTLNKDSATISNLATYLKRKEVAAFFVFGLIGLFSTCFVSVFQYRALLFSIWTLGTILILPFLVKYLRIKLGNKLTWVFASYVLIQCVLILIDSAICSPTDGRWHLGRVMIYVENGNSQLCRPHAWYQEPGYFAAFSLLTLPLFWLKEDHEILERKKYWAALQFIVCMAVILTTSRMGWLGVLTFVALRLFTARKVSIKKILPVSIIGLVILTALFSSKWQSLKNQLGTGLMNPTADLSFQHRFMRSLKAYQVFRDSPLVGVGPGTAGAWMAEKYADDKDLFHADPNGNIETQRARIRRDPLAQNLYMELLSEWGILGTISFFIGLFFVFLRHKTRIVITLLCILSVIYLSTQTLARFDLWFGISLFLAELETKRKTNV